MGARAYLTIGPDVDRDPRDAARLLAALAQVVEDPTFTRSPALTQLLEFLVNATARGEGKALKSYSVAVDGMGRSPDFDSQIDTYARVLVARLRKALDAFYANAGAHLSDRLLIESGSYEVQLVEISPPDERVPDPPHGRKSRLTNRRMMVALAACVAFASALAVYLQALSAVATERWRTSNFPMVRVSVSDLSGGKAGERLLGQMRRSVMATLDDFEGVRVAYDEKVSAKYTIMVNVRSDGDKYIEDVSVIDLDTKRLLWSKSGLMTFREGDNELDTDKFLEESIFTITHSTGVIHSFERRRNYKLNNQYGCWLKVMADLQVGQTISDRGSVNCAGEWYSAAPNSPIAAALYGWTMTDGSLLRISEAGYRNSITKAVEMLEKARITSPSSPTLRLATMRSYAFAGDRAAVKRAASELLAENRHNLDVQGVAGLLLVLQNDPRGEVALNKAIAKHFNPPPWFFVGTFVAAMMRDDPKEAGASLEQLNALQHALPIHPMLSAAYEARTGHIDRSRTEWERAAEAQPILRINPEMLLSRLPIAPEVKARLEQWLAPVLPERSRSRAPSLISWIG